MYICIMRSIAHVMLYINIKYTSLLLLASLATTFLWLSTGTCTDETVAGRIISSIHEKASTACSCTMRCGSASN